MKAARVYPVLILHLRMDRRRLIFIDPEILAIDLDPIQRAILSECNGETSLATIRKKYPVRKANATIDLVSARHLLIRRLLPKMLRPRATRWMVIAPHADDAALSVGGTLLRERRTQQLTLLTLVTHSKTSILEHISGDPSKVTEWRRREDQFYADHIGAALEKGGLKDVMMRRAKPPGRSIADVISQPPTAEDIRQFASRIRAFIRKRRPDVLVSPLGLGHVDHKATSEAVLRIVAGRKPPSFRLFFYEDLPYSRFNYLDVWRRLLELKKRGLALRPKLINIAFQLEAKLEALAIYRSQIPTAWIQLVKEYAQACAFPTRLDLVPRERLWELSRG